jgi:hypothetical protein
MRADAAAASVPACPPPMTMTSKLAMPAIYRPGEFESKSGLDVSRETSRGQFRSNPRCDVSRETSRADSIQFGSNVSRETSQGRTAENTILQNNLMHQKISHIFQYVDLVHFRHIQARLRALRDKICGLSGRIRASRLDIY